MISADNFCCGFLSRVSTMNTESTNTVPSDNCMAEIHVEAICLSIEGNKCRICLCKIGFRRWLRRFYLLPRQLFVHTNEQHEVPVKEAG